MSQIAAEPNTELAILLLAAGHDEKALRRHAGFASLRDARDFASRSETKAEVRRAVETRASRVGIKGLSALEQLLDSESTDGRTRVAAARTALEVAGFLGKDPLLTEKKMTRELSVAELTVLIDATRADLKAREARLSAHSRAAALIASS